MFDWLKKKNKEIDDHLDDDDEIDELMEELGFDEPELRSQKMYAFVHIALRDAVLSNHPKLVQQLEQASQNKPSMPLLHFWSKSELILAQNGIINDEDEWNEDEWMPFDEMSIEQLSTNGYRISVITLPKPVISPEAYMVAIVHKEGEQLNYNGERGNARYFTLEYSAQDTPPVLCEWDDEQHINYGDGPEPDTTEFARAVEQHLQ